MSFAFSGKKTPQEILKKISVRTNIQIIPERCSLSHRNGGLQVGDKAIFEKEHHKVIYSLEI